MTISQRLRGHRLTKPVLYGKDEPWQASRIKTVARSVQAQTPAPTTSGRVSRYEILVKENSECRIEISPFSCADDGVFGQSFHIPQPLPPLPFAALTRIPEYGGCEEAK